MQFLNIARFGHYELGDINPSKIQLEVSYQWLVLIGWATTRLYVIAH